MTLFVRKASIGVTGVKVGVFGPFPDRDAAVAAIQEWADKHRMPLHSGLPYPDSAFWADDGNLTFWIEPGQGTPASTTIE